jgi:hypothetical protein
MREREMAREYRIRLGYLIDVHIRRYRFFYRIATLASKGISYLTSPGTLQPLTVSRDTNGSVIADLH